MNASPVWVRWGHAVVPTEHYGKVRVECKGEFFCGVHVREFFCFLFRFYLFKKIRKNIEGKI
jgi:hypothetical protein